MIVPAAFAEPLVARSGDAAHRWLAELPTLADDLLHRWSCTSAGPLMHGLTSVVIPTDRADRSRAVLKLSFAPWCSASERAALHAWGGRDAVWLLEHDDARSAMLLERLRPLARPEPAPFTAAGRIVRLLSVPAPAGLPTLADKVSGWLSDIRAQSERLGHPLSAKVIDAALHNADELTDDQPALLVHGDLHFGNVMRGDQGLLAIDPHGLAGDPAHDFLQLLRNNWNAVSAEPDIRPRDGATARRVRRRRRAGPPPRAPVGPGPGHRLHPLAPRDGWNASSDSDRRRVGRSVHRCIALHSRACRSSL